MPPGCLACGGPLLTRAVPRPAPPPRRAQFLSTVLTVAVIDTLARLMVASVKLAGCTAFWQWVAQKQHQQHGGAAQGAPGGGGGASSSSAWARRLGLGGGFLHGDGGGGLPGAERRRGALPAHLPVGCEDVTCGGGMQFVGRGAALRWAHQAAVMVLHSAAGQACSCALDVHLFGHLGVT